MNNELKHYGIVGMKWGVRRYQNPDGTYTQAGKERYDGEKKEWTRELRNDKRDARRLTRDAAATGKAYDKASRVYNEAAKTYESAKEAGALNDGIEKRYKEALDVKNTLESRYKEKERAAEQHRSNMAEKYGEEHVSEMRYKDRKGGTTTIDNGDATGRKVAMAFVLNALTYGGAGYAWAAYNSSTIRGGIEYAKALRDQRVKDLG